MSASAKPSLPKLARDVCRILEQEIIAGKKLLANAAAMTEAITCNNTARMEMLESEGNAIVTQQTLIALRREQAVLALASGLGYPMDDPPRVPPLSEMAIRLPLPETRRLLQLRQEILGLQRLLEDTQARNRALLENALVCVHFTIDMITQSALKPAAYGTNPNTVTTPTFYIDQKC
jgi:hypothetical protein